MSKKYYMVIDTETLGDFVFNIGYKVIDRKGNTHDEGSFVINEFINNPDKYNAFHDRFMGGEKIARYYYNLFMNNGKYENVNFETARDTINSLVNKYHPICCAYNAAFDAQHLDITAQEFGYDSFFNEQVQWLDIWGMALSVLCKSINFFKFVSAHNFKTSAGNPKTSAEVVYRYLTNDVAFEEEHTARADVEIEADIMFAIWRRKKKTSQVSSVSPCFNNEDWKAMRALWEAFNI